VSTLAELNPLRYRGYYYDNETGMYYLQSRYYDPELGRFISADDFNYIDSKPSIKLNAYAYCGNNPIKYVDPTGHDFTWDSIFDIILACIVIDFEFPEFRIPVSTSGSYGHSSKPSNNVTVKKSNWVSDIGVIIGVVITEIFTCLDLQLIASELHLDFSFNGFWDYLQLKTYIYKKAFDEGIPDILPSALEKASEAAGKFSALLGFFDGIIPERKIKAATITSYVFNIANDVSGRYISPVGTIRMLVLDIGMNGLFDVGGFIIGKRTSPIVGNLFSIAFGEIFDSLGSRGKAEFLAYNWYYLRFVDWSKI
ncbi:MAG: RHS repeat-associated core domain-containing protein, partial [Eubacterium sp.]|nr:RHS repeat-associated core domain-containing protein [Eubacterium sp.]MDE6155340.1 RHS repeat-associated core domain-containing protein [Eubacterium sp.]